MSGLKRWIAIARKVRGKPNGVIPSYAFDDLGYFKLERTHKNKQRRLSAQWPPTPSSPLQRE